jgi:predicted Fe-Mo cluster-binding NifX family protein
MRFALTVFGSTISPLFDTARRLLVADITEGGVHLRDEEEIADLDLAQRAALLKKLGVQALACGAISEFSHNALLERGIEVYPWVSGEVQDLLAILAKRYGGRESGPEGSTCLAIPTDGPGLDARVAPTFRHCSHLLFVESLSRTKTVTKVKSGLAEGGGCCLLAKLIVEADARVLLTGRCGPNALGILAVAGVEVILGVEGRVEAAVEAYVRGTHPARSHCVMGPRRGRGRKKF